MNKLLANRARGNNGDPDMGSLGRWGRYEINWRVFNIIPGFSNNLNMNEIPDNFFLANEKETPFKRISAKKANVVCKQALLFRNSKLPAKLIQNNSDQYLPWLDHAADEMEFCSRPINWSLPGPIGNWGRIAPVDTLVNGGPWNDATENEAMHQQSHKKTQGLVWPWCWESGTNKPNVSKELRPAEN